MNFCKIGGANPETVPPNSPGTRGGPMQMCIRDRRNWDRLSSAALASCI